MIFQHSHPIKQAQLVPWELMLKGGPPLSAGHSYHQSNLRSSTWWGDGPNSRTLSKQVINLLGLGRGESFQVRMQGQKSRRPDWRERAKQMVGLQPLINSLSQLASTSSGFRDNSLRHRRTNVSHKYRLNLGEQTLKIISASVFTFGYQIG